MPLSESHIVIIMVIFSLILSGMCFTFIFNCVKKLIRDHQTIQVSKLNSLYKNLFITLIFIYSHLKIRNKKESHKMPTLFCRSLRPHLFYFLFHVNKRINKSHKEKKAKSFFFVCLRIFLH